MHARRRRRPTALLGGLVVIAAIAAGCSGDDDPTKPRNEAAVGLADPVERCLKIDDDVEAELTELPIIDCDQLHTHQIYAATLARTDDDVYPGFDKLETQARVDCFAAFEPFVGRSPIDSKLFYTWMVPTLDGWNDKELKDREILCIVGAHDGSELQGSVAGINE